jgi:hypothetical protein
MPGFTVPCWARRTIFREKEGKRLPGVKLPQRDPSRMPVLWIGLGLACCIFMMEFGKESAFFPKGGCAIATRQPPQRHVMDMGRTSG